MILAAFIWQGGELLRPTDSRFEAMPEVMRDTINKIWALRRDNNKIQTKFEQAESFDLIHGLIQLQKKYPHVAPINKIEWFSEDSWDHNAERFFPEEKWERLNRRRES